jgi:hypothetical protein
LTVTFTVPVEGSHTLSVLPEKLAVTVSVPTGSWLVAQEAVELLAVSTTAEHRVVEPSEKVTVPE